MNTDTPAAPEIRAGSKFPDFSEEQKAILQEIANNPDYKLANGYRWSLAFREHPEWKRILLTDQGRPFAHLWHASRTLQSGTVPSRPFQPYYKATKKQSNRKVELKVVGRGPYKKKPKQTVWERLGKPHPFSKEARAARAATATLPPAASSGPEPANFCPHCGAHRVHFGNRA